MRTLLALAGLFLVLSCATSRAPVSSSTNGAARKEPLITYTVVKAYAHDTTAYTEGLLVHEGRLWESTGSPDNLPQTRSLLGMVDTATGRIEIKAELDRDKYFGEGIAFLGGKLYQATFKSRTAFVYDAQTFKLLNEVRLPSSEGWGLTTDGIHLIVSNGSSKILIIDPATLKVVKTLVVRGKKGRVASLNELELIGGSLYANVWRTNGIVRIDTATGEVTGRLDLSTLVRTAKKRYRGSKEVNGIAYDSTTGKVYVTGKMWPYIYELSFAH